MQTQKSHLQLFLTTVPFSSLYVPPAVQSKQHADIALLDASQAEFDNPLLAECLHQPGPCNEHHGGASSVKISQSEVKKHFSWLRKRNVFGNHIACLVPCG